MRPALASASTMVNRGTIPEPKRHFAQLRMHVDQYDAAAGFLSQRNREIGREGCYAGAAFGPAEYQQLAGFAISRAGGAAGSSTHQGLHCP